MLLENLDRWRLCKSPASVATPTTNCSDYSGGEGSPVLTTLEAARLLRLQPQTLRLWACKQSGPIRPIHVGRLLRWLRADIDALLRRTG